MSLSDWPLSCTFFQMFLSWWQEVNNLILWWPEELVSWYRTYHKQPWGKQTNPDSPFQYLSCHINLQPYWQKSIKVEEILTSRAMGICTVLGFMFKTSTVIIAENTHSVKGWGITNSHCHRIVPASLFLLKIDFVSSSKSKKPPPYFAFIQLLSLLDV